MTVPFIYQGLIPTKTEGGLSSLQLAMANDMIRGGTPFKINQDFLNSINRFASSAPLSPNTVDPKTGLTRTPDISTSITGITYQAIGDDIYLWHPAPDCGPEENQFAKTYLGKRKDIAEGTWAFYGKVVFGGTVTPAAARSWDGGVGGGYGSGDGGGGGGGD